MDLPATEKRLIRTQARLAAMEKLLEDKSRELFQANEKVQNTNDHLENIIGSMQSCLIVTDHRGIIKIANEATLELLDYDTAELVGQPLSLIEVEAVGVNLSDINALTSRKSLVRQEIKYKTKAGTEMPVLFSSSAMYDTDGTLTGIVCVALDLSNLKLLERQLLVSEKMAEQSITERNKTIELNRQIEATNQALEAEIRQHQETEEQLNASKLAAEEANRAKSDFLANMSHEIRTPMNAILGLTQLTLESELNGEQEQHLSAVMSSATALLDILNDILDLSKIEAGKLGLEHTTFDLRTCMERALQVFALRTKEKGVELTCHIEPGVPDCAVGDAGRLRQIIVNILGNAIKFTEEGSIEVYVRCLSQREERCDIEVTVRDTGIGVSVEQQKAIFAAFSQADSSTTRRFGGTGLGLSISSLLVSMMDGDIWLESEVGKGSTFYFTVNLGMADEIEQSAYREGDVQLVETATATEGGAPSIWRILLVEDNAFNQMATIGLLKKCGHSIDVASNGREALETLEENHYDVVLMDVQMPVMDGVETTRIIRHKEKDSGRHMPIVGLTANAMAGDRERYLATGMDAYTTKPVQSAKLLQALHEAINK
jgi:PAS domain S-box-containing protein